MYIRNRRVGQWQSGGPGARRTLILPVRLVMRRLVPLFMVLLIGALASAAHGQTRGGFDDQGRLLMQGTPRFVLGVFDSGGGFSTLPSHWETQIFSPTGPRGLQDFPLNLYLNYHLGQMPIAPTNALLGVLQDHG